jgi:hypothetical protein
MHQNSRLLAEQAFQNYLIVMLVSLLSLFPSLSLTELGYSTLSLTALRAGFAAVRTYRTAMQPYGEGSRLQALRASRSRRGRFAAMPGPCSRPLS